MSKQKTQLKGKRLTAMVASIAMVAATALSLGAATYAWFTRGTEASATGFDFTASAAQGIQVSTSGKTGTWKSHIIQEDFNGLSNPAIQVGRISFPNGMEPVSTSGEVQSGALTFYEAEYTAIGDGSQSAYVISENTGDYLEFDLYFENTGQVDLPLKLDARSIIIDSIDNNKQTSLSTRAAFINHGTFTQAQSDAENFAGVTPAGSAYIWEPNSTVRSTMAENNKNARLNAKYDYNGVNQAAVDAGTDAYDYISNSHSELVETQDVAIGDNDVITNLAAGLITKVRVYVWMEGQDIDNDNTVSAGSVQMELYFGATVTSVVAPVTPEDLTASLITLSAPAETGAVGTYTVYVLRDGVDGKNYNFRELVFEGVKDSESNTITISEALEATNTYTVVVVGRLSDHSTAIRFANFTLA